MTRRALQAHISLRFPIDGERERYGHQLVLGTGRCVLWLDRRAVVIDWNTKRIGWYRRGQWHPYHIRQHPEHWYGRIVTGVSP